MCDARRAYFDSQAEKWNSCEFESDRLQAIIERFGIRPGDRVLDVGAGTGRLSFRLGEKVGEDGRVVSVDFSHAMLAEAQKLASFCMWHFVCADVLRLSFADDYFDKVICFSAFPHFRDKRRALLEMRRVMARYGRLLVVHLNSSGAINSFHQSLGGVVAHDELPAGTSMHQLLDACGYNEIAVVDEPHLYWAEARKS